LWQDQIIGRHLSDLFNTSIAITLRKHSEKQVMYKNGAEEKKKLNCNWRADEPRVEYKLPDIDYSIF